MKSLESKTHYIEDTAISNVVYDTAKLGGSLVVAKATGAGLFKQGLSARGHPVRLFQLVQPERRATHGQRCSRASAKLSLLLTVLRIRQGLGQHQHEQQIQLFCDGHSSAARRSRQLAARSGQVCAKFRVGRAFKVGRGKGGACRRAGAAAMLLGL